MRKNAGGLTRSWWITLKRWLHHVAGCTAEPRLHSGWYQ